MRAVQIFLAALGRILISLIFILSGIGTVMDWTKSMQYFTGGLQSWSAYAATKPDILTGIDQMQAHSSLFLGIAVALQIVGGLLVFFGIKTRFGAFLLLIFLIPTTILMHAFWLAQGPDRELQMIMFMKNISMLGAVLYLLAFGNGTGGKAKSAPAAKEKT